MTKFMRGASRSKSARRMERPPTPARRALGDGNASHIPLSVRDAGGLALDLWQRGPLDYEGARAVIELQADRDRLREAGDRMATEIEARWSEPGTCECAVCTAASGWRTAREALAPSKVER